MPQARALPAGAIARLGSDNFRSGAVIDSMAFSADGRFLFSSSHWAEHVSVWSVPDGRHVQALDAGGSVRSMAVSADGRWCDCGQFRNSLRGELLVSEQPLQKLLARLHPEEQELPDVVDELIELGEENPDRVVPAVLAVDASDTLVRESVIQVLGGLGSKARSAIPFLVDRLRDTGEEEYVRSWAANSLGQMQTESQSALMELCKDADPYVRGRATDELGNIGIYASAVIETLLNALIDPVAEVRDSARRSLARKWDCDLAPHLSAALKHPLPIVRVAVAQTLLTANPKDWAALQTLVDVLREGPAEARVWACEALPLAKEAGVIALEELQTCLRHEKPAVRAKAAWALSQLRLLALPALAELGQALHDEFADVRFWSAHALMRLDELAEPVAGDLVRALEARAEGTRCG